MSPAELRQSVAGWKKAKRRSKERFWLQYARAKGLSLGEVYRRIRVTKREGQHGRDCRATGRQV